MRQYIASASGGESVRLYGRDMKLRLRGRSIGEAVQHAAHRLHGRRAFAHRVTEMFGMSGVFQCYVDPPGRISGSTSVGANFHVMEDLTPA